MENLYEILGIERKDIEKDDNKNDYDRKKLLEKLNNYLENNKDVNKIRKLNSEIKILFSEEYDGLDWYDDYVFDRRNDELVNMVNNKHTLPYNLNDIDKRSMDEKSKEKENKRKKVFKVVKTVILVGVITAIGLGTANNINKKIENNKNSNVCVSYEIQANDTLNELQDSYGLLDIGHSYLALSGAQRQREADKLGMDIFSFLAIGDVIIGRTTKENADKLVNEKGAKIISVDEAIELLGENNSLVGEFKKYSEGSSNMVFYTYSKKSLA